MVKERGFVLISILLLSLLMSVVVLYWYANAKLTIRLWSNHDLLVRHQLVMHQLFAYVQQQKVATDDCLGWQQPMNASTLPSFAWHKIAKQDAQALKVGRAFWHQDCFRHLPRRIFVRQAVAMRVHSHWYWWYRIESITS